MENSLVYDLTGNRFESFDFYESVLAFDLWWRLPERIVINAWNVHVFYGREPETSIVLEPPHERFAPVPCG